MLAGTWYNSLKPVGKNEERFVDLIRQAQLPQSNMLQQVQPENNYCIVLLIPKVFFTYKSF